jgi:hypothetical protein
MIGSAVSVDRQADSTSPPVESADGAAYHQGDPAMTRASAGQGSGAGADAPAARPHPTPTTPPPALGPEQVRGPVLVLRVPADENSPVGLVRVAASAVAFSDALGGGFLDDALDGCVDGDPYVVLLDEHRVPQGLPGNQRAAVLAARLGHVNRAWLADLRGDALVLGCGHGGTDTDVPGGVIDAARWSGLLHGHEDPSDGTPGR